MNYRISGAGMATLLAALGVAGGAAAQALPTLDIDIDNAYGRGRNISVLERERPEYDALGEHVGGFTLFPKLEASIGFNDNVYATKTNQVSDGVTIVKPSVELQSNWSRHALALAAGGEFRNYFSNSTENETGWYVRANGHVDVYGDSYILIGADAERTFEERTDAGSPADAAKPIPIETEGLYARGVWQLNRFRTTVGLEDRQYDYDNVPRQDVATHAIVGTLDNSGRNRNEWRVIGREEFAVSPDTAVFGQVAYADSRYRRADVTIPLTDGPDPVTETLNRNSTEIRGIVGANFDFAALLRGEFGAGYVSRDYQPVGALHYPTISGPMFEGKLEYFPTELTTVTLVASRMVEDAIYSINSGGYFNTNVNLRVDHELLRNLLLNASVGYDQNDYEGADRHDRIFTASGGARYLMNRTVGLGVTVNYADRNASGSVFANNANPSVAQPKPQFNITTIMFSLVLQR